MTSQKPRDGASPRVEIYRVKPPSKGPEHEAKPLIFKDVPDLPMAKPAGTIKRFRDNGNCNNGERNGPSGALSRKRAFQVRDPPPPARNARASGTIGITGEQGQCRVPATTAGSGATGFREDVYERP
jgi:hypothetical protein